MKGAGVVRGRADFTGLFTSGRRLDGDLLRCYLSQSPGRERLLHVGFAVSSKQYGAVRRNRIRRLMREAFRREELGLLEHIAVSGRGIMLVIAFRPRRSQDVRRLGLQDIHTDLAALCVRIKTLT